METLCTGMPHTVTLAPRLRHSAAMLDGIICSLRDELGLLRAAGAGPAGPEAEVLSALEAVSLVRAKAARISGVASIPGALSASVMVVRAVSASLYCISPGCSRRLSELSVHLGSIALDSAAISQARFDFGRSNSESSAMLDEAKLIAGSKLRKLYPNDEPPEGYVS